MKSYWSETGRERKRKKKSGLRRKLKVSTLDIQIKQSGLKVSNSKVFSSDLLIKYTNFKKDSLPMRGKMENMKKTLMKYHVNFTLN